MKGLMATFQVFGHVVCSIFDRYSRRFLFFQIEQIHFLALDCVYIQTIHPLLGSRIL
jgi:hypothetical protein